VGLTDEEQVGRQAWFRRHWEEGVAFNQHCKITVRRWDPDGVELALPYADHLSAHTGVFHGGVISALIDTAGTGAALAVQYLSAAPGEDAVAYARCTRRGSLVHYAEVTVRSESGKDLAQGLVTAQVAGERAGLEEG
jgi:uncharacterized protein (TIGR00369 family)